MKDKEWWLKLIAGTIFFGGWLLMAILKKTKPEADLSTAFYISIILSVVGIVGFFSKNIKNSLHKEQDIKVMSNEDIMEKIKEYAYDKIHNNLREKEPAKIFDTDTIGSDIIYAIRVHLNLDNEEFIMIINASFSGREPVFLNNDAKMEEIRDVMNRIARKPKSNTFNEKVLENESTGVKITTRSTIPLEDKKEEDAI